MWTDRCVCMHICRYMHDMYSFCVRVYKNNRKCNWDLTEISDLTPWYIWIGLASEDQLLETNHRFKLHQFTKISIFLYGYLSITNSILNR